MSRWAALASAVAVFTSALASTEPIEYVALVSYASDYKACGVSNKAAEINQALASDAGLVDVAMAKISSSVFNGGTEIATGIDEGVKVLTSKSARPFAAKTMIVMTDGHQQGGSSPVTAAANAAKKGIIVHTITFGDGAAIKQMRDVAAAGEGKHYHANDLKTLQDAFRKIALSLPVLLTE